MSAPIEWVDPPERHGNLAGGKFSALREACRANDSRRWRALHSERKA